MKNFPVFTSKHSVGLTFLSWSYHWLAGHHYHWNAQRGFCPLPNNPVTGINAHFFKKNYCAGYQEWHSFLTDDKNNLENCSMYGGPLRSGDKAAVNQDYAKALEFASQHASVIFCVESKTDPWYFLSQRAIPEIQTKHFSQDEITDFQNQRCKNFLATYFNDSIKKFENNIWDLRELIALNYAYFKVDHTYLDSLDRSIDHLYIDSRDLWYNGEKCLYKIFAYIDKPLVTERLEHWRNIYHEWQSIQLQILQFNWYLPVIIESVIKNYNFDIDFLNLTLLQEAVIQGSMIKEYNLNFRCYGLQKFPSNTKDLHLLLEENSHL